MGILLLFVFIPSVLVWGLAVYATVGSWPPGSVELVAGISLALAGLVGPLIGWKMAGKLYALEPPFVYLILCVMVPGGIGLLLSLLVGHGYGLLAARALCLAVSIVFPVVCSYFFLVPERWSVPNLLGIKPYH